MSNMANQTVSQARSFKENPRHYPRKFQVGIYNAFSTRLPYKPLPKNPKKILVQSQEKIGDAILLLPTIGGLKKLFPGAVINVLCSRKNEPIFNAIPVVEKTLVYRSGRRFWHDLTTNQYDLFYNPKDHPSITAFKIAKVVNAGVKVSLAHPRHEKHYNHGLTVTKLRRILEKNGAILQAYRFGSKIESFFPKLDHGVGKNKNEISINLSAGSEARKWSFQNWVEMIELFLGLNSELRFNIFTQGNEAETGKKIASKFGLLIALFSDLTSILDAGQIIQKSSILVSPDTAMIHVADAVGTPVVGLYSGDERNVERYRPYWVKHEVLQSKSLSIQAIPPIDVFNAATGLVQG